MLCVLCYDWRIYKLFVYYDTNLTSWHHVENFSAYLDGHVGDLASSTAKPLFQVD